MKRDLGQAEVPMNDWQNKIKEAIHSIHLVISLQRYLVEHKNKDCISISLRRSKLKASITSSSL